MSSSRGNASKEHSDSSLRELVWVASGFTLLTLLYMAPLVRQLATSLPDNPGDAHLNAWVVAWGADRLLHGLQGFWSPPIFYPYQNTLAYSENLLGVTVLVAPVQWLLGNPILTYNVAVLLSFVLAGLGAYALGHELTGRRGAALVGACAFAFAPYRWAQLPHLQVLSVGWLPLALWALHRSLRSPSWAVLVALVAAVLLQTFSYGYSVFQTALAIALVSCWCAARSGVARATLGRMAAAAAVMGILLAPAIVTHYRIWSAREPIPGELARYSADLGSYLDVAPGLPHASWLPGISQGEGRLFPGLAVILLTAVALVPLQRRAANQWRWLYGTMALAAMVLSLGPEPRAWGRPIPVPPVYSWLLSTVPLFDALRVPARFGLLAVLAFAMLAAMGVGRILARQDRARAVAIVGALCAVILWEGYGGPLAVYPDVRSENRWDDAAYAWLARQPRGAVLNLPLFRHDRKRRAVEHQYAALVHRQPIVEGVSRLETPLQAFLSGTASPLFDPALLPETVPFLRGLQVRYLLVRPDDFADPSVGHRQMAAIKMSDGVRLLARFDGGTLSDSANPEALGEGGTHADSENPEPAAKFLIYEIAPPPPQAVDTAHLVTVPSSAFRLSASRQPERLAFAIDGDPRSRWTTGQPQNGTEWITLDFDRPRDVARLEFRFSPRSVRDYPRRLEIRSIDSEQGEQTLYHGGVLAALGRGWLQSPDLPVAAVDLPPGRRTRLLIRQRGQAERWYWSIDELGVWERP